MAKKQRPLKFLLIEGKKSADKAARNIINAAKRHFDVVLSVPIDKIRIECANGKTRLRYRNIDLTKFDACYPRLFYEDFVMGQIILDILENSDVFLPVSLDGYQIANHKFYTTMVLGKVDAPVPVTALAAGQEPITSITESVGFPVVVKLLSGFGGKGVMLAKSMDELKPIIDTLNVFKEFICAQEFVKNKGYDLRCYVVGNDIHAVKRFAPKGEWRTNVSRGAIAKQVDFPDKYRETIQKCAKVLGLGVCSVDLLEGEAGPSIIEINFCPGMIVKYFGDRFAQIFMEYIYEETLKSKMLA